MRALRACHGGCACYVSDYTAKVTVLSIQVCQICTERENCWLFNRLLLFYVFLSISQFYWGKKKNLCRKIYQDADVTRHFAHIY